MSDNVVQMPTVGGLVALRDLPERPPIKTWYAGFPEWRHKIALAPSMLSVCTGHPGHGKSTMMGNVWFNAVERNSLLIVVATFENHPVPSYRKKLRQFHCGKPQDQMDDEEIHKADEFIHDHYRFILHPQERPTLDFVLDQASKTDLDILLIDPWNRLESQRRDKETETEYAAWCLIEARLFAVRNNCHVQIIAHPAKRDIKFRDRLPSLEDISGSKNFDNMPDQGFVVHRENFWNKATNEREYDAKLYHLKAREEELGYPCCMSMRLDPKTQRFECTA